MELVVWRAFYNMIILNNEVIDNFFLKERGYIPQGGKDRAKILKEFGYKRRLHYRPQANLYDNYEEDMVECEWCKFIAPLTGINNPIHPLSWISNHKGYTNSCKSMHKWRNYLRTTEELKTSTGGRIMEDILKVWMKTTGQEIFTKTEIEEQCYEKFGKKCFLIGKTKNIHIDHTFPLIMGWPLTPKNATPLSRSKNSSKRACWPNEFYTYEKLIELSKISGYTLEELSTPKYNYPFFEWCDENWDIVKEIVDKRGKLKKHGGKIKFLEGLRETIHLSKMEAFFDHL